MIDPAALCMNRQDESCRDPLNSGGLVFQASSQGQRLTHLCIQSCRKQGPAEAAVPLFGELGPHHRCCWLTLISWKPVSASNVRIRDLSPPGENWQQASIIHQVLKDGDASGLNREHKPAAHLVCLLNGMLKFCLSHCRTASQAFPQVHFMPVRLKMSPLFLRLGEGLCLNACKWIAIHIWSIHDERRVTSGCPCLTSCRSASCLRYQEQGPAL